MTFLKTISTDTVKTADRLKLWQDIGWKALGRPLRATSDGSFQAKLESATLVNVSWCKITASGHRIEHTDASNCQNRLHVIFQLKGRSYREQGDRAIQMSAGEGTISELCKPYVASSSEDIEIMVLGIPSNLIS